MAAKSNIKSIYNQLVKKLKSADSRPTKHSDSYGGNKDKKLHLRIPTIRSIAKDFIAEHNDLTTDDWVELFHLLVNGEFDEEKQMVGKILENSKELRRSISLKQLEKILAKMKGWSQVDCICQSIFSAEDLLIRWPEWKEMIIKLSKSSNLNKKRASLVLLTAPVRQSNDKRFANLAFDLINDLKTEEDKLITKAVSWILREMIKNHREMVAEYLNNNKDTLPAIALRETENKLTTGRK